MPKARRGRYRMYATAVTPQKQTHPRIRATINTAKSPSVPRIGSVLRRVEKMLKSIAHPAMRRAKHTTRKILVVIVSSSFAMLIISLRSCLPRRTIQITPRLSLIFPQHFSSITPAFATPYICADTPVSGSDPRMICSTTNDASNRSATYSYLIMTSPFVGRSPSSTVVRFPYRSLRNSGRPSTSSGTYSAGSGVHSDKKTPGFSITISLDSPNPPT
mmetsp:Transcript_10839/g.23850  ORF Transcript_10839/g.23850 Transcript_10839/m.23850 type:complete len:217 (-) Transcript_10839:834-1484(-)